MKLELLKDKKINSRECWFRYCRHNDLNGGCKYPKNKECPILNGSRQKW